MATRRPAPTTTLQLLVPPAPARQQPRRIDPREVIDLTVRTDNRLLLSVEEAAERLGIGRSLMYELISSGQVAVHPRRPAAPDRPRGTQQLCPRSPPRRR